MKRVLSIQSHVVSGYVGNKCAVFPMQVLGYDVDSVNSVQFCNHTGYKEFKGQVLNSADLNDLYDGLKNNGINEYSHILTGYCGSESFLREIVEVVKDAKTKNPNLIFVCDPVMGDRGFFYVPESLMAIYRDEVLPCADMATPNQFELELLSGKTITNKEEAFDAMQVIHDKGVSTVVLSSAEIDDKLILLGSTITDDGEKKMIELEIPKISCNFTGTGDLFTALFLVWQHTHPTDLLLACEKTISTMQTVLNKTFETAKALAGAEVKPTAAQRELQVIQCKRFIEDPKVTLKGSWV